MFRPGNVQIQPMSSYQWPQRRESDEVRALINFLDEQGSLLHGRERRSAGGPMYKRYACRFKVSFDLTFHKNFSSNFIAKQMKVTSKFNYSCLVLPHLRCIETMVKFNKTTCNNLSVRRPQHYRQHIRRKTAQTVFNNISSMFLSIFVSNVKPRFNYLHKVVEIFLF